MGLRYLVERDLLIVQRPLSASEFARFCSDRGVSVNVERLEALEKCGVFYPLARVQYPLIKVKIERVDEHRIRHHGMLKDGEAWDGEVREEYSRFSWRRDWAVSWLDEGFLWDPRTRPFEPWKTFRDAEHRARIESFYSPFQAYTLAALLPTLTLRVPAEYAAQVAPARYEELYANIAEWAKSMTTNRRLRGEDAAFLAQVLANRYFFLTLSDNRTIRVSEDPLEEWQWEKFARTWDARAIANELGVMPESLQKIHEDVVFLAASGDPLENWYDLVSFVASEKKDKLKKEALFAQHAYAIEHMLRLFYEDLTSDELPYPDERWSWSRADRYGEGVTADTFRHLEFVVNEYHLNPRPRVVLVVEGEGEVQEIPKLVERRFGYMLAKAGVEIRGLGGISDFTGSEKIDRHGALEKFIDEYHLRGTVVFCLLDDENQAGKVAKKLVGARSRFVPGRMLTRPEYIRLWDTCIEFDNFSDEEIAAAMRAVAEQRYTFTAAEVALCRTAAAQKKGNPLAALYREKLAYGLDKVALMRVLFDMIIDSGTDGVVEPKRWPILDVLRTVIQIAAWNQPPTTENVKKKGQESGFFGDWIVPPRSKQESAAEETASETESMHSTT